MWRAPVGQRQCDAGSWFWMCQNVLGRSSVYRVSGVVAGGDQQVGQHQQLVVCELLLMLLPVVVVRPPEVGQRFLHGHLETSTSCGFDPLKPAEQRRRARLPRWVACRSSERSGPSTAGASRWARRTGWREYKRSGPERRHGAAPGLRQPNNS